ncbi:MAG: SsrA-binding protein SmpB [Candidatus Sumerlaeia bacterium]|nr:SsrA-binding protein SmpB [Candidatus Sumerlaeia bacterium]
MSGDRKSKSKDSAHGGIRIIATNRRARHEYEILEDYEAGLVLRGTEVKSLRAGHCSLVDSYASFQNGELYLHNMDIPPYEQGNRWNVEAKRSRKLLLHRDQLRRLIGAVTQKGLTLIPLKVYFSKQYAKVQIALCRGKRTYDKRETLRRRDEERELDRVRKMMRKY